jgi:hypothetical protein
MSAGQIVEHGSHTGLLERHGFYDDLYSSQFRAYPGTRRLNPAGTSFGLHGGGTRRHRRTSVG